MQIGILVPKSKSKIEFELYFCHDIASNPMSFFMPEDFFNVFNRQLLPGSQFSKRDVELRCYACSPLFSSLSCLRQKEVVLKFRIGPWHALVCFSYNSSCLIQFRFEGGHNFVGLCHRLLFTGYYRILEIGLSFVIQWESTLYFQSENAILKAMNPCPVMTP